MSVQHKGADAKEMASTSVRRVGTQLQVQPQSYLRQYMNFVRLNRAKVQAVEDLLRGVVMFMPGRYTNAHLTSEMAFTVMNLLEFFHDRILEEKKRGTDMLVKRLMIVAEVTKLVEFVAEMLSVKAVGPRRRWRVVLFIEIFKILLKLVLLRHSKSRILVHRSLPSRSEEGLEEEKTAPEKDWSSLMNDVLAEDASSTRKVARPLQSTEGAVMTNRLVGEVSHICRPLIYVLCMMRFGRGSWVPWLASAYVDFTSSRLTGVPDDLTDDESRELWRRRSLLLLYLVRSPFLESFSRAPILRLCKAFSRIPLLGMLAENGADFVDTLGDYYFYTAGT